MSNVKATVAPSTEVKSAPSRPSSANLSDTFNSISENAKSKLAGLASSVDPRNIDWSELKKGLPTAPALSPVAKVMIVIVAVTVFCISMYYLIKWYEYNANNYPVLLSDPIRGANIGPTASRMSIPTFPVVDRDFTKYQGITLPYRANDLAFIDKPRRMPEPNHKIEFTLNFWMRIENYQYNNPKASMHVDSYTELFRQNPSTRQFRVLYDSTDNTLVVTIQIRSKKGLPDTPNTPQTQRVEVFRIPRILLVQEWQMITLVLENRDLDVYHNSKLYRSFHLANVPDLVGNEWRLFPGQIPFTGMISCARYFHYGLNTHEVSRLYKRLHGKPIPRENYLFWWTWYKGNSFTALFDNFQKEDEL